MKLGIIGVGAVGSATAMAAALRARARACAGRQRSHPR
jgi:prephenate dehydrogenase